MVVNVETGDEKHNLSELFDWLNDKLQATFSQVEHTCSGIFDTNCYLLTLYEVYIFFT